MLKDAKRDPMREIPDWKLERLLLRELPAGELDALDRQLAEEPLLQARLEALRAASAELLALRDPSPVARSIAQELWRRSLSEKLSAPDGKYRTVAFPGISVRGFSLAALFLLVGGLVTGQLISKGEGAAGGGAGWSGEELALVAGEAVDPGIRIKGGSVERVPTKTV